MKRPFIKYSPLAVIILLILVIGYYLFRDEHLDKEAPFFQDKDSSEGLKMTKIHYTQNNPDEGVKWILDAEEGTSSNDIQHMAFKDFHLRLEPESGSSMELEGKGGEYDRRTQEISLSGALRGMTNNGYQIMTDHIVINQKEGYVRTEEPVKIIGPFFSIEGKGLLMNMETEKLSILSDVITFINRESVAL
jgi:LPS export ABC transporter protein LptC